MPRNESAVCISSLGKDVTQGSLCSKVHVSEEKLPEKALWRRRGAFPVPVDDALHPPVEPADREYAKVKG